MELRPYQQEAVEAIEGEWAAGRRRTLLVLPTGTGKTVVFATVMGDAARQGERSLVLAHRGELLAQAADKIRAVTGMECAVEKAEQTCVGSWNFATVGSVQTLMRDKRLDALAPDRFDVIVVDEAHHALADSYRKVLEHFPEAKVLGVTATPDRADRRNLGAVFDSLAYEYTMPKAIKEGYLCPIKAQTIPLKLDISMVKQSNGDFSLGDLGSALDPYLEAIADEMVAAGCADRRTVVFLPLVATSKKFRDILLSRGLAAVEVNGESADRAEILADFDRGRYQVLCNSMLLTEGWDCPSVDCIIVLRATKSRALYCLDEVTEILTQDGWKSDVEIGEMVATFNTETGAIEYKPCLATVRRPLDSDEYFCSISGQQSDIRVTNHHRMIYDNKRFKGWKIAEADYVADLKDGCYIPVSGTTEFPGVPLTDDELRFIGWFLSDGTLNKYNNAITITQGKHQPWIGEIKKCIEGCGFKYGTSEYHRISAFNETSPCVRFSVSKGVPRGRDKDKRGWEDLEPYIGKQIPDALFNMTEHQFDVMLEAIHLGDGAKQLGQSWTRRSYHISTGDKIYAERLQIMAIQRGWKADISIQHYNSSPLYILHMKKKSKSCIGSTYDSRPTWIKEQHTDESCWCVETDAGTIVTRRNGKVAILGNCQMVGRGTRLSPETGKEHLLLLDFLWHTATHELCRPAHLIAESDEVADAMTARINEAQGALDLEEVEQAAEGDVVREREERLAEELKQMRKRKRKLVDPLQFEMSIAAEDLSGYVPSFGWEMAPMSDKQRASLEKFGIFPDEVECAGKASLLLDRLGKRRDEGLTTPKQIRLLERYGFRNVGTWRFDDASKLIGRISAQGWRVPRGIDPATYQPEPAASVDSDWLVSV